MECLICGTRPRHNGGKYCRPCADSLPKDHEGAWWAKAFKYAVWRGYGVAFMPDGKGNYKPVLLPKGAIGKLTKAKVINLDQYCEGYERMTIKRLKAAIKACNYL